MTGGYAFGDDERAAERLALVAEAFDAPSRAFLAAEAPERPDLAVDLGCGPGHTTRLLAEVTGAARAVGLDVSEAFLARARRAAPPELEFVRHDVTETPFPTDPADLLYARLVLAHLPDAAAVVRDWRSQLAPGGRLLVEELDAVEGAHPVLRKYEELAVRVVAAHGGTMYTGSLLDDAGPVAVRTVEHRVPVDLAARIYAINLSVWRGDPALTDRETVRVIGGVAAGLDALAGSHGNDVVIWHLHQAVFEGGG